MESYAPRGAIQVTPRTFDRLRARYDLEPRGTIEIKGKGPLDTYLLIGASDRPADRSMPPNTAPAANAAPRPSTARAGTLSHPGFELAGVRRITVSAKPRAAHLAPLAYGSLREKPPQHPAGGPVFNRRNPPRVVHFSTGASGPHFDRP